MEICRLSVLATLVCILSMCGRNAAESGSLVRVKRSTQQNPCADLRYGQLLCLDCATLALCVQQGGDWVTMQVETCANEKQMFCDEEAKGCTLKKRCEFSPFGNGIKFECQNPGTYPDPYNCKYYHECNGLNQDTRYVCPSGMGYSASSKNCIVQTNSTACREQRYHCEHPGTMDAWPDDANIFYMCSTKRVYGDGDFWLYPILYRCRDGYIFDGESCVPGSSSGGDVEPTVGATTTTLAPMDMSCTGSNLSANPSDCRTYYVCRSGQLALYNCPAGYYFSSISSSCVTGSC